MKSQLITLHIENVAVIENADIDLFGGFTVFTGETGAGKSIVIDSIQLLLGGRASRELIRTGAESLLVQGVFAVSSANIKEFLCSVGFFCEDDGSLIISREVFKDGRNVCRINGRNASVSVLRDLGGMLCTIHGQHDNQALLNSDNHIYLLDEFAGECTDLREYRKLYGEIMELRTQLKNLTSSLHYKFERLELTQFEIGEIESANVKEGEYEELHLKKSTATQRAKLLKGLNLAYSALNGENGGALDSLTTAISGISDIAEGDEELEKINAEMSNLYNSLSQISGRLQKLIPFEDVDVTEGYIEERLLVLEKLRKKYGDYEEMSQRLEKLHEDALDVEHSEVLIEEINQGIASRKERLSLLAESVTFFRNKAARRLEKAVTENLEYLDMNKVRFTVSVARHGKYTKNGADNVEFLISANEGEELKPLAKIASGGELSRIMLSLKSILRHAGADTMIFDEIDSGVSGRTAEKIGLKMKQLSAEGQVMCITHSAQIAAHGDTHMKISKTSLGGKTYTSVDRLDTAGREAELARILGGINITDTTVKAAREMINYAKDGRQ